MSSSGYVLPTQVKQKKYPGGYANGVHGADETAKLASDLFAELGHKAFPHFQLFGRVVSRRVIHHP